MIRDKSPAKCPLNPGWGRHPRNARGRGGAPSNGAPIPESRMMGFLYKASEIPSEKASEGGGAGRSPSGGRCGWNATRDVHLPPPGGYDKATRQSFS
jgi:hypothetical protein